MFTRITGCETETHKLIYYYADPLGQPGTVGDAKEPEWELFDLEHDPCELKNVVNDPDRAELVAHLKAELERLQSKVGDIPYVKT